MVQRSLPYLNKTGYSMFWNSMWDNKNNYCKFLQKDFFIKSFINFFFSDYIFNQLVYKYNNNSKYLEKYNFNNFNKNCKLINRFLINSNQTKFYLSKIWLFRYQNWIILFFYIFSKNFYKFKINFNNNKNYLYNYVNNFVINIYFNFYKNNFINNNYFEKYNF